MVLLFLKNHGERGKKGIFLTFHFFFPEEPNSPFLACVSMVIVPRTVWRCSKFGARNYLEGSVSVRDSQVSIIYHQQEPFFPPVFREDGPRL